MLQVVTFITLPSSSYSLSIFTHVRREISKVKKLPLPLSKCFLIYQVLRHWMTGNRSPIYCKTQQRVSSNRLLSLLPMARVRLEFKRTVSDFKQVVIDPRCILYIPKYRAKCEQTLHARKSRYTVRIFPPTYFTICVFSTLRLHFHSGTRGVNNRRRQARVDRSIVGRVLYIYANNLRDALCNFRNPFRTRWESQNNINSEQ